MFPPPPPPEACHPPVPCVESRANISFTLATTREELCAPLLGHREVHVHYTGEICDPEGLKIQWTAARTLDPRLVRNAIRSTRMQPRYCRFVLRADYRLLAAGHEARCLRVVAGG